MAKAITASSPLYSSVDMMVATFARVDVPQLGFIDEHILYADIDILFVADITLDAWPTIPGEGNSLSFVLGTEIYQNQSTGEDPQTHESFAFGNAGVLLMHVERMRESNDAFVEWIFNDENIFENHLTFGAYGPVDEGALNMFYQGKFEVFESPLFNWKPFWGGESGASLVHFQGPKPQEYLSYATHICNPDSDYAAEPEAIIVQLMDQCLAEPTCMHFTGRWLAMAQKGDVVDQDLAHLMRTAQAAIKKLGTCPAATEACERCEALQAGLLGKPLLPPRDTMSMHHIDDCNVCGVDWCQKVDQGKCVTFNFNDGTHALGPGISEVGCDALADMTPYCTDGSDDIYGYSKATSQGTLTLNSSRYGKFTVQGQKPWARLTDAELVSIWQVYGDLSAGACAGQQSTC
jgi:hypothetical protein